MTRSARIKLVLGVAVSTVGVAIVLGLGVFDPATVAAVYVLVVGAQVLLALTKLAQAAADPEPSLFAHALRRRRDEQLRPPELIRIERELVLGMESAGHLHARLLPLLREAAAARLAAKHNVDLDRRPEAARALLGEEAWDLLRPDRAEPVDRRAHGIPQAKLRALLDVLEQM
jgi:hypothetical protein